MTFQNKALSSQITCWALHNLESPISQWLEDPTGILKKKFNLKNYFFKYFDLRMLLHYLHCRCGLHLNAKV